MKNLLILIGAVYLLTLLFKPAPAEDYNSIYKEPVILYATDWCGYCKKVKQIFEQKGVAYKEFNIETSSQSNKEFKALGGKGVPLTLINGTAVHGYNPSKIKQLVSEI